MIALDFLYANFVVGPNDISCIVKLIAMLTTKNSDPTESNIDQVGKHKQYSQY